MNKKLKIVLFAFLLFFSFSKLSYTDYSSDEYDGLYRDVYDNKNLNFRDLVYYSYVGYVKSRNTYYLTMRTKDDKYYYHYPKNFKIFLPKYLKTINMGFGRFGSAGGFNFLESLGKKPYKGPNRLYAKGQFELGDHDDKLDGNEKQLFGIYKDSNCKKDYSCKVYFNRAQNNMTVGPSSMGPYDGNKLWQKYITEDWTIRYYWWHFFPKYLKIEDNLSEKFANKWLYYSADARPMKNGGINYLDKSTFQISLEFDKNKIDNEVIKKGLDKKFKNDCSNIKENAKNFCYYIRSFPNDNEITDKMENITQNNEKENVKLKKGLNLLAFGKNVKLNELSGCEIGVYNKGQYSGKKAIFGVIGQDFVITPNTAENSTFTKKMGIFIHVKGDCTLKY